jgi:hypothetical protein
LKTFQSELTNEHPGTFNTALLKPERDRALPALYIAGPEMNEALLLKQLNTHFDIQTSVKQEAPKEGTTKTPVPDYIKQLADTCLGAEEDAGLCDTVQISHIPIEQEHQLQGNPFKDLRQTGTK